MRIARVYLVALVLAGCTGGDQDPSDGDPRPAPSTSSESPGSPTLTPSPAPTPEYTPARFDGADAFRTVQHLANDIGPREGTSSAFTRAARYVKGELAELGYLVSQVPVPVPAGNSWGVDVPAGDSANVIADPPGFNARRPHVVIGAHLDTVPQAPGAEDNGSGIGVMLELAEMAATSPLPLPLPLPVRFVAFGAEEPRGEGDDLHHFGSRQYVADMAPAEQRALRGMVSLDRVGVRAASVPVCTGGTGATRIVDQLAAAATSLDIDVATCADNRSSDHWSFEKADLPSARLGSVPYAGYHSADDVPSMVDQRQLRRVGRIVWAWFRSL